VSHAAEDAPLAPAGAPAGSGQAPKLWWALLELFALTGRRAAAAGCRRQGARLFLYHRAGRTQILAVIALIVLAPAAAL
jgi:hypothetical protein